MPALELWTTALLLDISIKAALLAIAAGLAMACFRVRGSHLRHRVWLLVLGGMLLLPGLVHLVPGISLPHWLYPNLQVAAVEAVPDEVVAEPTAEQLPIEMETADVMPFEPMAPEPATVNAAALVVTSPVEADEAAPPASVPVVVEERRDVVAQSTAAIPAEDVVQRSSNRWAMTILLVYLIGVAYQVVRLLLGLFWTARLVRRTRPIQTPLAADCLPRSARLAESGDVRVPLTIGYWRPVVVLPADWANWSETFLAMVLAHEGEHVRRRDTWAALLAAVNCAVYWFHPVAWFVRHRLTDLAEQVCDDTVIQITGSRGDYAQNLLEMAGRLSAGSGRLQPVGVAMARKANVVRRIEAIIDRDRPLARRLGTLAALLLLAAVVPLIFLAAGLRASDSNGAVEEEAVAEEGAGLDDTNDPAANVKGRVVMASDGSPVVGAEVKLRCWTPTGGHLGYKTCLTDATGNFEFAELEEGRYFAAAYRDNLTSRSKEHKYGQEVELGDEAVLLELREACSLHVTVVNKKDGKPIAGAMVYLGFPGNHYREDYTCDENGEVFIRGLTSEVWPVWSKAKGFALQQDAVSLTGTDTTRVTIELEKGTELSGTVRDDTGKVLAGKWLSLTRPDSYMGMASTETDKEGRYRFENVPLTEVSLYVQGDEFEFTSLKVRPGEQPEFDVTLARRPYGGAVCGIVVDSDGSPVAGATIENYGMSSADVRRAETGEDGRFRIDDVLSDRSDPACQLEVKARGFAPRLIPVSPGTKEAPAEVEIALQPGHSLRGQVVDADGAAIAGVRVLVRPTGFDNYQAPFNNRQTDEQGRFEFDSLPPDVQLTCIKDGYSQFDERCYPDMLSERRITMLPAAVIRGRVVDDATGEPVPAFEVRPDIRYPRGPARKFAHSNGEFVIKNLKRGGRNHVAVEANGYDREVLANVVAMPIEDAEPIEFRVTPVDPSQLVVIAGRIVDEKSQPVAGAQVRLIVASGEPALGEEYAFAWNSIRAGWVKSSGNVLQFLSTTTDREGRFRLDQVRPSSYMELAWWGTGILATRTRSLEEQPREELANLTIQTEASGNVRLELDRERFREVECVFLDGPHAGSLGAVLPQNDAFEIRDAPAGHHDLLVQGAYRKSKRGRDVLKRIPIEVKAGETVTVDYETAIGIDSPPPQRGPMPAPAPPRGAELSVPKPDRKSLKGRVIMATDDAPVADAEVWLLSPKKSGLDKKSTTTNERGEFEFTKLTEGRKILAAYYENLASRTKMYKGREAKLGEQGIVLRLSEAPSLKVKVVTRADSKPLEDATVRLTWTDAKQDHKTDANGEVLIRGLTAETWTIETHAKGYAEDVQAISLRGTETASVTARLDPGIELYGVVRDEEGQGLPGAGISVFPSGLSGKQIEYMETEADGSFRFPYLPIMGFTLIVSKEGYVETRPDVAVTVSPGGRQELNLTLERRPDGGSVQGIVVDKAGYPVPDAKIINRGATIPRDTRETTTDAEGRYRLDDVFDSLGHHRLHISAKGFAPQILQFEPGEREKPTQLDVTLEPGHRVHGRVVNEEGEALAGVEIYYGFSPHFSDSDYGGTARTDSEGRFELDSLSTAPPIRFRKGGYSEIHDENLLLDGEEEVVVTMRSAGALRGRVVDDQTSQPVKSFTVSVTFSPDRQPGDPSGGLGGARVFGGETFSTKDGMFRLGDFIHGMPLQVTVKADGYDPAVVRRVVAVPEENAEEVEFRLTPVDRSELLTIAGRLVNEQGTALPGAEMRLIVATKRPFPRDAFPFNWTMIRLGQVQDQDSVLQFLVTVTDPQGRFRFEQVRNAGDIELAYWGEGVSQARKAHLERLSAEALKKLTITTKTPGIVRGKIDRKAYPNVSNIMLSGNDEFFEASLSAKRDSYEIRNVPEGSYELQVYVPSARKDEYGRVDSSVIRRGRVAVQSGQAVTLNIEREASKSPPPDQPGKEGPSDGGGKAVTEPKPEEPDKDMGRAESASPQADGANETEIAVHGTVTDESGRPIRGARLWLPLKFDGEWMAEATTDDEGAFTLHVPVAWTKPDDFIPCWVIWCYGTGRQIAAVSAYKQLKRQSKSSIEFVLGEPTDTGFEVRDPEGEPLEGARVEPLHFRVGSYDIVPETLRDLLAKETDAEGRVRLPEIARDKLFTVRVTADSFGIQELRLRDSADEPAVRTIQLRPTGRIEGRLVSDNEAAIRKRHVYVSQEDYVGEHTSGAAMVETDEEGRFVVPALAEGKIRLGFRVDRSIPLRPRIPEDLVVYAGETTQVEVPMEKTVRVRGRVQTKGKGLPVAGAMISVQYGAARQSDHVQTDEDGWFEADVLAGAVRRQLIMKPDRYSEWIVEDAGWQHPIDVPKVENFELPPLELIETTEVAGQLVDRDGQPVANAHVRAITGNRVYAWGTSDSDGRFTLLLPKDFQVEEYDANRTHGEGQVETSVKQQSPLVLQLIQ